MVAKKKDVVTLVAVGDVAPSRDDPPSIFSHCGEVFHTADIVFGQMEDPLSDRGTNPQILGGSPPHRLPAKNISALTEEGAGFDVMSHACNHAMDYGWEAFYDTLDILKKNNIAVVGAGRNIDEARKPAILEKKGTKVGFLAYLSVARPGLVAEEDMPGCVPLRSSHFYEQLSGVGSPPLIITNLFPEDKKAMEEDIKKLRPQVDVLVVSMHAGVLNIRAMISMYQKEAAYAAIDSGADLVLQHHAHILKGIEVYKGKVIFYGLGNFALEHGLSPSRGLIRLNDNTNMEQYRRIVARLKVEPGYPIHRFHHDALKTIVAKAYIKDKKIQKVSYIPAYINPNLEPEVLTQKDPRAREVFDYMKQISESEELRVNFSWDGDEVLVS